MWRAWTYPFAKCLCSSFRLDLGYWTASLVAPWIARAPHFGWPATTSSLCHSRCLKIRQKKGFREASCLTNLHRCNSLSHPVLENETKGLLRGILSGGVWSRFLPRQARKEIVFCGLWCRLDGDGHLFWDTVLTSSPLVLIRVFGGPRQVPMA